MDGIARALVVVTAMLVALGASCVRGPEAKEAGDADASTAPVVETQPAAVEFVRAAAPIEIDLNSGDVRGMRYRADGTSAYGVYESELSKEVRRLGIPTPEQRDWWRMAPVAAGGGHFDMVYRNAMSRARRLLDELDEAKATNAERRDVLERFMTSLRGEDRLDFDHTAYMLILEVRRRHAL